MKIRLLSHYAHAKLRHVERLPAAHSVYAPPMHHRTQQLPHGHHGDTCRVEHGVRPQNTCATRHTQTRTVTAARESNSNPFLVRPALLSACQLYHLN